jgi:hypothetical protein
MSLRECFSTHIVLKSKNLNILYFLIKLYALDFVGWYFD